ncbi:MAG: hypothetical protein U0I48_10310, partial [Acutalibacteraceae bacterium]|nr:hypothetical protein [Acutalibacteraceae bacterium]
ALPPVSRKGTHRKGSLGKALEEGLQRGGTAATVLSPLIKHRKFDEEIQEAVCFIKRNGTFQIKREKQAASKKKREAIKMVSPFSS